MLITQPAKIERGATDRCALYHVSFYLQQPLGVPLSDLSLSQAPHRL